MAIAVGDKITAALLNQVLTSSDQTLQFAPAGNTDTPASGSATWVTLGTLTVPSWATRCQAQYSMNGYFENSGTVPSNVQVQMRVGSATGLNRRLMTPAIVGQRASTAVMDAFVGLTPGSSPSVTLFASFVASTTVRADTTAFFTAHFSFQP